MQFLDVDVQELFKCDKVIGKRTVVPKCNGFGLGVQKYN